MPETLLQTKLFIPALRPNLVHRSHLDERLNQGLQQGCKLTLVTAPAGFGKTTLVSSWIRQLDHPAAWLSLDEGDNEPNSFIFYVIAPLQTIDQALGETAASLLQSPQPPPPNTLLTLLINDLAALPNQVFLVLDDYHVIKNLEIHQALTFLLDHQPPPLHLIIVSREDPALPLHRLRGSGQMTGIYVRDMRFTSAEVASFLNKTMGLSLSQEDVATLARRTEGWVAGLQLAALSMQDMPNPSKFVSIFAGDDRYISDYLISEVFERQPAQVQEFLLKTAILDRFSAPLCDAILGDEDQVAGIGGPDQVQSSQDIIERLDQSNLFIISLDNKREWYRYHHLFADFLRLRLRERPADEIAELHRRAAACYEDKGLLAEAIDHALAGEDFHRASRLIEWTALTTIFGHTQWATFLEWMEALPAEMVRIRPQLSLNFAWALFTTGRWEDAEPHLNNVGLAIDSGEGIFESELMLGEVATIRAMVAYESGDMLRCEEQARQALGLLPEDNRMLRCVAILAVGMAHLWGGDISVSRQSFYDAADMAQVADNKTVALFAVGFLAQLEVREGHLQKAEEHYQQAKRLGTVRGRTLLGPTGFACVEMGEALREWNELEEAKRVLAQGVELCLQQSGMLEVILEGQINLARTMLASGEWQNAAETMQQAEILLAELSGRGGNVLPIISMALAYRLRFWLAQGSFNSADQWLAANGINADADISSVNEEFYILLIRLLIHQDRLQGAEKLLQQLLEAVGNIRSKVEILILQALLFQAQGNRGQAVAVLTRALRLAEPEGYLRLFVDQDKAIIPLLEQVAGRSTARANIEPILAVIAEQPHLEDRVAVIALSPESKMLLEPLKDQEIRILRLMAAGLSNREIADEVLLSTNTIKVYASRIYSKLGTHRRGEAVARAQELGLL